MPYPAETYECAGLDRIPAERHTDRETPHAVDGTHATWIMVRSVPPARHLLPCLTTNLAVQHSLQAESTSFAAVRAWAQTFLY